MGRGVLVGLVLDGKEPSVRKPDLHLTIFPFFFVFTMQLSGEWLPLPITIHNDYQFQLHEMKFNQHYSLMAAD